MSTAAVRLGATALPKLAPVTVSISEMVSPVSEQIRSSKRPQKAFSLHIGADLRLPTPDVRRHSRFEAAALSTSPQQAASDPFEGLPFRALAERMGATMSPVVQAVRADARAKRLQEAGLLNNTVPSVPEAPSVPHFLPITRWISQSPTMKSTFVVDKAEQPKARLSWYHPDDTMVPRGWWKTGLLEDLKYYKPFGWSF